MGADLNFETDIFLVIYELEFIENDTPILVGRFAHRNRPLPFDKTNVK